MNIMHTEEREAYDKAFEKRRDFDHKRILLIDVAVNIYTGHAASADNATTVQVALRKAQELIRRVDDEVGERPVLPDYPEEF